MVKSILIDTLTLKTESSTEVKLKALLVKIIFCNLMAHVINYENKYWHSGQGTDCIKYPCCIDGIF